MTPVVGSALLGLAWATGLGMPLLVLALLLAYGGDQPNGQLLGLAVLGLMVGGAFAFLSSMRIRNNIDHKRAEVLARLRHAHSPAEARVAVEAAAVFAGDANYANQTKKLSDQEILALCDEILEKNERVARFGPHERNRPRSDR